MKFKDLLQHLKDVETRDPTRLDQDVAFSGSDGVSSCNLVISLHDETMLLVDCFVPSDEDEDEEDEDDVTARMWYTCKCGQRFQGMEAMQEHLRNPPNGDSRSNHFITFPKREAM